MKLHLQTGVVLLVTGSGPGWIRVNADEYRENLVLTPEAVHPGGAPGGFDALAPADFAALLDQQPEIVLFGTGAKQRFPHPRLTAALIDARVGVEVMDTPAACRTFNILTSEGRRVVALLLID
ncbi:MAG TPA: Mth938-like domain-containing protein [Casimicrobiaceae bacterium]